MRFFLRCHSSERDSARRLTQRVLSFSPVSAMSIRGSSVDVEAVNSASPLLPNDWGARGVRLGQSLRHDFRIVLFSNHSNVLLVFVPFAVLSDFLQWSSAVIFTMNFLALIPLALLLSFATKELTKRVGSTGGSLINVTFG